MIPTRRALTAGPVLIRLTGTPAPTKTDGSPQVRYVLIFRLSRGYKAVRNGWSYGWFEIAGDTLDPYPFGQRGAYCFAGVLEGKGAENPAPAHILDKKRPRDRVQVRIRPLTMRAGKNKLIEHPYLRHPRTLVRGCQKRYRQLHPEQPCGLHQPLGQTRDPGVALHVTLTEHNVAGHVPWETGRSSRLIATPAPRLMGRFTGRQAQAIERGQGAVAQKLGYGVAVVRVDDVGIREP